MKTGSAQDLVACDTNSCGAIALGDINSDGKLDLFRGNRAIPGRYPQAPEAAIYVSKGDDFVEFKMPELGLVTAAVFGNVVGDEAMDLIVACEWGSLRIFENSNRRFIERTEESGLSESSGWWSSVAVADLNGDGRSEIIGGNWGRNSRYRPSKEHPERLYYLDADEDGAFETIEAHFDPVQRKVVPWRGLNVLGKALPFIREQFPTHGAFATASVEELLGDKFPMAKSLEVNCAETMVFWNRGGKFDARALPVEAQFAPVHGICAADFNGDGAVDLFLSQGFLGAPADVPRHDAGAGLILLGDGTGGFRALSAEESGVWMEGEQRGCVAFDFNRDGKMDLAVGQNRGPTKLFRNVNK